jgi:arsenate reductase
MPPRQRVLFVCTHNSARSQMAEGFLRAMAGDRFEVASAGTEATRVHPLAITAMQESGVDIAGHKSKTLHQFEGQPFDYVITVCSKAAESCPVFAAPTRHLAWDFEDPSKATGTEEERLAVFRKVRNEIRTRLQYFLLTAGAKSA